MSNKLYTSIPAPKVPRNTFDRSRPNTTSLHFQRCYPTMLEETIPGDLFKVGQEVFARLQPLIAPVMNNMKISNHFFFVPLRTLNKHFAEFMFNNRTGDYADVLPYTHTDVLFDVIDALYTAGEFDLAVEVIRLYDFIGLPFRYRSNSSAAALVQAWNSDAQNQDVADAKLRVNLCPFFAYQKVWSEYYRDENLEEDPFILFEDDQQYSVFDLVGDQDAAIGAGPLDWAKYILRLRPRAWAHDRFTSALPFAQRGPDVLLPIAGTAPVRIDTGVVNGSNANPAGGEYDLKVYNDTPGPGSLYSYTSLDGGAGTPLKVKTSGGSSYGVTLTGAADFDNAALTTTINSFRRAERLQRWYENSARGGVRPNEATLAHFGVKTPDATLDRAEFLGGSSQPIVVSEVEQNSSTDATSPQGNLAGKGTSYKSGNGFKGYFTEHGFVLCFTSCLVRANYWQGIPKVLSRMQRDEYYWPEFANLGEEPVFTKELFVDDTVKEDDVFGYVPRYSDYKSAVGEVHGDMRSSLAFWTQNREFSNPPQLNKQFMFANPSLSPFAVQSMYSDPIVCTIQFHVKASRLMPFYGVPTI